MNGQAADITRIYKRTLGILAVLTVVTVALAQLDLGIFNTVLAITIAGAKAALVLLFFMHVRWSPRLVWVAAGAGFFWFAILVLLTLTDFVSRSWDPVRV